MNPIDPNSIEHTYMDSPILEKRRGLLSLVTTDLLTEYEMARLDSGMEEERAQRAAILDLTMDVLHHITHMCAAEIELTEESKSDFKKNYAQHSRQCD
jgi:hypothetical protein